VLNILFDSRLDLEEDHQDANIGANEND